MRSPLAPRPRYWTPFPCLRDLRADTLGTFERLQRDYGDAVCLRLGPLPSYLLVRLEAVRHVLVHNHRNYWKGRLFGKLRRVAGDGLLFTEGERWRRQRRLVAPVFQRAQVQALVPAVAEVVGEALDRLEEEHAQGGPFELLPEMSQLALDVACRALLGGRRLDPEVDFHATVNEAIDYSNYILNHFLPPPLWVPTRRNRRARRTLAAVYAVIDDLAEQARDRRSVEGFDLLRVLMETRDEETGEPMSRTQLRHEMQTFLIAGHETTAVTLTWAFHLLGGAPEETARLRREAEAVLGDGPATAEFVAKLERTRRAVMETLRLYPPAWAIAREAYEEDAVCGVRVRRGANVTLSPWLTHRHPAYWEAPERFDPDRFLPERAEGRPRGAYFPFGAGGRRCVDEDFAMLKATLALASLLRRLELRPVPGPPVEPDPILTLWPRHGLRVTLACA